MVMARGSLYILFTVHIAVHHKMCRAMYLPQSFFAAAYNYWHLKLNCQVGRGGGGGGGGGLVLACEDYSRSEQRLTAPVLMLLILTLFFVQSLDSLCCVCRPPSLTECRRPSKVKSSRTGIIESL